MISWMFGHYTVVMLELHCGLHSARNFSSNPTNQLVGSTGFLSENSSLIRYCMRWDFVWRHQPTRISRYHSSTELCLQSNLRFSNHWKFQVFHKKSLTQKPCRAFKLELLNLVDWFAQVTPEPPGYRRSQSVPKERGSKWSRESWRLKCQDHAWNLLNYGMRAKRIGQHLYGGID